MAAQRLLLALVLVGAAYLIYTMFTTPSKDSFATPLAAGPVLEAPFPRGSMNGAAAGPNPPASAPAQRAEQSEPPAQVAARDPYDETVDRADAPERITHPENYYGPAIVPESSAAASMMAVGAGLASVASEPGPHNAALFSPEMVGNGAAMADGIMAAEPTHGLSFSTL